VWCSLWGTDWIIKCYLDELRLHASHSALPILNSSKLSPVADDAKLFVFQIIDKVIRNSKFRCLFEATSYYHNVFTFTLLLPEGCAGVACEPSNKMLFLPLRKIKVSLTSPLGFLFASTLQLSFPSLFGSRELTCVVWAPFVTMALILNMLANEIRQPVVFWCRRLCYMSTIIISVICGM
jgi:hypothetical protein